MELYSAEREMPEGGRKATFAIDMGEVHELVGGRIAGGMRCAGWMRSTLALLFVVGLVAQCAQMAIIHTPEVGAPTKPEVGFGDRGLSSPPADSARALGERQPNQSEGRAPSFETERLEFVMCLGGAVAKSGRAQQELDDLLSQPDLSPELRDALGRFHPGEMIGAEDVRSTWWYGLCPEWR